MSDGVVVTGREPASSGSDWFSSRLRDRKRTIICDRSDSHTKFSMRAAVTIRISTLHRRVRLSNFTAQQIKRGITR